MFSFIKRIFSSSNKSNNEAKVGAEYIKRTRDSFKMKVERNLKGKQLEKEGRIEEAIELYEKNIEKGFDGSHPYDRLCIIYRKQGKIADEIRVLEKAIRVYEKIIKERPIEQAKLDRYKERLEKVKKLIQ